MQKNVLFRGCTRPAMFLGVPYVPFFIGAGGCLMGAMYSGTFWKPGFIIFLLLLPTVIFIMRQMARRDEMIFRLLGLNWRFQLKARNRTEHSGALVFSPHDYRRTPAGAKRKFTGPFLISGKMTRGLAVPAKAAVK